MKKVTSADSLIDATHLKNLLVSEGIAAVLKNTTLVQIFGEMPAQEVWPEVWIENDLDYDRALQLIDLARIGDESPTAIWKCEKCGEENEGQFAACWSCGQANE